MTTDSNTMTDFVALTQQVSSGGCAAKLGPGDLMQVLHKLPAFRHKDLIVGTETADDAGVFRLRPDLAIVNTVDFFTPMVDDPFVFGQVAAANALSDVYAMGGDPRTALNIVAFPVNTLDIRYLGEILRGGAERVKAARAVVLGGHSIIDPELKYGLSVTGVIHPARVLRNVGARVGDAFVLTKALGTGIVTTGLKRRKARTVAVDAAIASMITLNQTAAAVMRDFPVHACSDVTGFGLLGHAREMAGDSLTIELDSTKLPLLPDAPELAEQGCITGGCARNRKFLHDKVEVAEAIRTGLKEVAFDPQTSGGLLIAVSRSRAEPLVSALRARGVRRATIVGHALAREGQTSVRLV